MVRSVNALIGRRVIAMLGVFFVVVASVWGLVRVTEGESVLTVLISVALIAGPGVVLLYSWYRLPHTDIDTDFYPLVSLWCLGGVVVVATVLTFYHTLPGDSLGNPYRTILALSALSSTAGLGVAFHDARARTRGRELRQRNRELQEVRALLEESNERLEESNERLEQFAHAASHDLREPLRMITSYLGLLERRYADELDEEGEEYIEFAVDGAERMREMIDGLLEYARVETQGDPFESVDLNDVLADVQQNLELQIGESAAEIEIDHLPHVVGDRRQLRQVFQNLIYNAIEYSGDEPPRVHVSADRNGQRWIVSVSDEGIGIDSDDQERVFEVFQRLHTHDEHAGTGIGLALCQRIVEHHGGRIWVESEVGEGSTFSFTLSALPDRGGY